MRTISFSAQKSIQAGRKIVERFIFCFFFFRFSESSSSCCSKKHVFRDQAPYTLTSTCAQYYDLHTSCVSSSSAVEESSKVGGMRTSAVHKAFIDLLNRTSFWMSTPEAEANPVELDRNKDRRTVKEGEKRKDGERKATGDNKCRD